MNKHDLLAGKGPYYLDKRRVIGKYQDFSKEYKSIRNKNNKRKSTKRF